MPVDHFLGFSQLARSGERHLANRWHSNWHAGLSDLAPVGLLQPEQRGIRMSWVVLSTLFSPASSCDDASELSHNPIHLNKTSTESSALHSPHLYPSLVLARSSIFGANCRPFSKCHRTWNFSARQVTEKKKPSIISWQLGTFSDEVHR